MMLTAKNEFVEVEAASEASCRADEKAIEADEDESSK